MELGTLGTCFSSPVSATCTGTGVMKVIGVTAGQFSGQVFIVLSSVIGIAIAYFLFKFAWRKIKGSVN